MLRRGHRHRGICQDNRITGIVRPGGHTVSSIDKTCRRHINRTGQRDAISGRQVQFHLAVIGRRRHAINRHGNRMVTGFRHILALCANRQVHIRRQNIVLNSSKRRNRAIRIERDRLSGVASSTIAGRSHSPTGRFQQVVVLRRGHRHRGICQDNRITGIVRPGGHTVSSIDKTCRRHINRTGQRDAISGRQVQFHLAVIGRRRHAINRHGNRMVTGFRHILALCANRQVHIRRQNIVLNSSKRRNRAIRIERDRLSGVASSTIAGRSHSPTGRFQQVVVLRRGHRHRGICQDNRITGIVRPGGHTVSSIDKTCRRHINRTGQRDAISGRQVQFHLAVIGRRRHAINRHGNRMVTGFRHILALCANRQVHIRRQNIVLNSSKRRNRAIRIERDRLSGVASSTIAGRSHSPTGRFQQVVVLRRGHRHRGICQDNRITGIVRPGGHTVSSIDKTCRRHINRTGQRDAISGRQVQFHLAVIGRRRHAINRHGNRMVTGFRHILALCANRQVHIRRQNIVLNSSKRRNRAIRIERDRLSGVASSTIAGRSHSPTGRFQQVVVLRRGHRHRGICQDNRITGIVRPGGHTVSSIDKTCRRHINRTGQRDAISGRQVQFHLAVIGRRRHAINRHGNRMVTGFRHILALCANRQVHIRRQNIVLNSSKRRNRAIRIERDRLSGVASSTIAGRSHSPTGRFQQVVVLRRGHRHRGICQDNRITGIVRPGGHTVSSIDKTCRRHINRTGQRDAISGRQVQFHLAVIGRRRHAINRHGNRMVTGFRHILALCANRQVHIRRQNIVLNSSKRRNRAIRIERDRLSGVASSTIAGRSHSPTGRFQQVVVLRRGHRHRGICQDNRITGIVRPGGHTVSSIDKTCRRHINRTGQRDAISGRQVQFHLAVIGRRRHAINRHGNRMVTGFRHILALCANRQVHIRRQNIVLNSSKRRNRAIRIERDRLSGVASSTIAGRSHSPTGRFQQVVVLRRGHRHRGICQDNRITGIVRPGGHTVSSIDKTCRRHINRTGQRDAISGRQVQFHLAVIGRRRHAINRHGNRMVTGFRHILALCANRQVHIRRQNIVLNSSKRRNRAIRIERDRLSGVASSTIAGRSHSPTGRFQQVVVLRRGHRHRGICQDNRITGIVRPGGHTVSSIDKTCRRHINRTGQRDAISGRQVQFHLAVIGRRRHAINRHGNRMVTGFRHILALCANRQVHIRRQNIVLNSSKRRNRAIRIERDRLSGVASSTIAGRSHSPTGRFQQVVVLRRGHRHRGICQDNRITGIVRPGGHTVSSIDKTCRRHINRTGQRDAISGRQVQFHLAVIGRRRHAINRHGNRMVTGFRHILALCANRQVHIRRQNIVLNSSKRRNRAIRIERDRLSGVASSTIAGRSHSPTGRFQQVVVLRRGHRHRGICQDNRITGIVRPGGHTVSSIDKTCRRHINRTGQRDAISGRQVQFHLAVIGRRRHAINRHGNRMVTGFRHILALCANRQVHIRRQNIVLNSSKRRNRAIRIERDRLSGVASSTIAGRSHSPTGRFQQVVVLRRGHRHRGICQDNRITGIVRPGGHTVSSIDKTCRRHINRTGQRDAISGRQVQFHLAVIGRRRHAINRHGNRMVTGFRHILALCANRQVHIRRQNIVLNSSKRRNRAIRIERDRLSGVASSTIAGRSHSPTGRFQQVVVLRRGHRHRGICQDNRITGIVRPGGHTVSSIDKTCRRHINRTGQRDAISGRQVQFHLAVIGRRRHAINRHGNRMVTGFRHILALCANRQVHIRRQNIVLNSSKRRNRAIRIERDRLSGVASSTIAGRSHSPTGRFQQVVVLRRGHRHRGICQDNRITGIVRPGGHTVSSIDKTCRRHINRTGQRDAISGRQVQFHLAVIGRRRHAINRHGNRMVTGFRHILALCANRQVHIRRQNIVLNSSKRRNRAIRIERDRLSGVASSTIAGRSHSPTGRFQQVVVLRRGHRHRGICQDNRITGIVRPGGHTVSSIDKTCRRHINRTGQRDAISGRQVQFHLAVIGRRRHAINRHGNRMVTGFRHILALCANRQVHIRRQNIVLNSSKRRNRAIRIERDRLSGVASSTIAGRSHSPTGRFQQVVVLRRGHRHRGICQDNRITGIVRPGGHTVSSIDKTCRRHINRTGQRDAISGRQVQFHLAVIGRRRHAINRHGNRMVTGFRHILALCANRQVHIRRQNIVLNSSKRRNRAIRIERDRLSGVASSTIAGRSHSPTGRFQQVVVLRRGHRHRGICQDNRITGIVRPGGHTVSSIDKTCRRHINRTGQRDAISGRQVQFHLAVIGRRRHAINRHGNRMVTGFRHILALCANRQVHIRRQNIVLNSSKRRNRAIRIERDRLSGVASSTIAGRSHSPTGRFQQVVVLRRGHRHRGICQDNRITGIVRPGGHTVSSIDKTCRRHINRTGQRDAISGRQVQFHLAVIGRRRHAINRHGNRMVTGFRHILALCANRQVHIRRQNIVLNSSKRRNRAIRIERLPRTIRNNGRERVMLRHFHCDVPAANNFQCSRISDCNTRNIEGFRQYNLVR